MLKDTIWRARTIFKRGLIRVVDQSPPDFYHFSVQQRDGLWIDVWYMRNKQGIMEWKCNSLTKEIRKNGAVKKKWGCVMYTGDHTRPYCSHTLACQMYVEQMQEEYETEKLLKQQDKCGELDCER